MANQIALSAKVEIAFGAHKGKTGYLDRVDKFGFWVRGESKALFPYRGPYAKNQIIETIKK